MPQTEEKPKFEWRTILKTFQKNPFSLWLFLALIGIGLVLLLYGKDPAENRSAGQSAISSPNSQFQAGDLSDETRLETELTQTLSRIEGVGEIRVDVSLKSSQRRVWERQTRVNKRTAQDQGNSNNEEDTSDELVFAKDGNGRETPVLKEELAPEIQGVVVVATGARDAVIKKILTDTVMTIWDLPAHRVIVISGTRSVMKGVQTNEQNP